MHLIKGKKYICGKSVKVNYGNIDCFIIIIILLNNIQNNKSKRFSVDE